jgi:hypothetical protein
MNVDGNVRSAEHSICLIMVQLRYRYPCTNSDPAKKTVAQSALDVMPVETRHTVTSLPAHSRGLLDVQFRNIPKPNRSGTTDRRGRLPNGMGAVQASE